MPNVVTADIQAGMEDHIEEQVRLGGGYFKLPFDNKELRRWAEFYADGKWWPVDISEGDKYTSAEEFLRLHRGGFLFRS